MIKEQVVYGGAYVWIGPSDYPEVGTVGHIVGMPEDDVDPYFEWRAENGKQYFVQPYELMLPPDRPLKASDAIQQLLDDAIDMGYTDAFDVGWRLGATQALRKALEIEKTQERSNT